MKQYLPIIALLTVPLYGLSKASEELVKSMVPKREIAEVISRDYAVKTQAGTKIIVEFEHAGQLDEASGLNLGKGDVFEPGNGLISLNSVAKTLTEKGHQIRGLWKLEKDSKFGWIYELEGKKDNDPVEFIVDAKRGNIIKTEISASE